MITAILHVLAALALSGGEPNHPPSVSDGVTSTLALSKTVPPPGHLLVVVTIQNSTGSHLAADIQPIFELRQIKNVAFWSPVALDPMPFPLPLNGTWRLELAPKATLTREVDLSSLHWARLIAPLWPMDSLDTVVPEGSYVLALAFNLAPAVSTSIRRVESKPLTVVVRPAPQPNPALQRTRFARH
jgi:hypothetical protein